MALWNKNWAQLSGTYTGTVDKNYKVKITNNSSFAFKWASKATDSQTWSAWTDVTSVSLNTDYTLADGIKVKFIRNTVGQYQVNDKWIWNVYANLQLEQSTGNFNRLIRIEENTKDHLIALNSGTGQTAIIRDYESLAPQITTSSSIPVNSSYDYVVNNKLAYVGTGKSNQSQVIGFDKTAGFGETDAESSFIAENSYDQLNVIGTSSAVFDESVVLRGNAANYDDPDLLIGFDFNLRELKSWNRSSMETYGISLTTQPIAIRDNPAQNASGRTNGVAILCEPEKSGTINCLHLYTIGDAGNAFTRTRTIHLSAPDDNDNISNYADSDEAGGNWVDFLIVSTKADVTDSGEDYHLILSTGGRKHTVLPDWHTHSGDNHYFDGYIYKVENIDDKNDNDTIAGSAYVNITPLHDHTGLANEQFGQYNRNFAFGSWDENYTGTQLLRDGSWHVHFIQKTNLALMGYDFNGENPVIGITVKFEPLQMLQTSSMNSQTATFRIKNVCFDGAKFWYWIWATWLIPVSVTGRKGHPIMPHYRDWGQAAGDKFLGHLEGPNTGDGMRLCYDNLGGTFQSAFLWYMGNTGFLELSMEGAGLDQPIPSAEPLHSKGTGYYDGRKWGSFGSASQHSATANGGTIGKGQRIGFYYLRNRIVDGETRGTLKMIHSWQDTRPYDHWGGGGYTSEGNIFLFPHTYGTLATDFSNYSTMLSEGNYTNAKQMSFPELLKPVIPDSRYLVDVSTGSDWTQVVDNSEFLQVTSKNDAQNFFKSVGIEHSYNSNESNDIGANVPWLTMTVSALTESWVGPTIDKSFYKCSLLYDGFQETALIPVVEVRSESGTILTQTKVVIKIDETIALSKRVSAVVLYRADDSKHDASDPEGLYRFVKEVKLSKFSLNNGFWEAIVADDGTVGASYEANNGISETLGGLGLNYGTNCSLNGYMFVGKPFHEEFDDSDNLIFRSQPGKYSVFDWSKDFIQLKFEPTALAGFMGKLFVYGKSQLAIVNPETLIIEDEIDGIGCVGPKGVYLTSTGLYWFDLKNIYNASPKVSKIATSIQTVAVFGWSNLENATKQNAVAGYDAVKQSFQIYFTQDSYNRCWNFYEPSKRWDLWETPYQVYDMVIGEDGKPVLLCQDGRIVKYTAGSEKRNWEWESKKMTLGDGTNYKKVRVLKMDVDGMTRNNLTLQYQSDTNADYVDGTDVSNNYQKDGSVWKGTAKKVASADSKLRWIKAKMTGTNSGASNNRAHNLGIVYKPKKPK
tara:strand:+ start:2177 stop:5923 length:3747 start_codon:yes stop_codon:yes gene_type:complete